MAETSPKGINKISFSIKQMSYRKGFSYSRTKRFCENKMKAGQKEELLLNNKEKQ